MCMYVHAYAYVYADARLPAVAVLRSDVLALCGAHKPLHELQVAFVRSHVDGLVAVGGARAQVGAARAQEACDLRVARVDRGVQRLPLVGGGGGDLSADLRGEGNK